MTCIIISLSSQGSSPEKVSDLLWLSHFYGGWSAHLIPARNFPSMRNFRPVRNFFARFSTTSLR